MDAKKLASLFDNPRFKTWFGKSAAIDEGGAPKTLYHGTNAEFDTFDPSKFGQTDEGWLGRGFYFSPDESAAQAYGRNVMPAHLSMQNPFRFPEDANPIRYVKDMGGREAFTNMLREQGYDGAISDSLLHQYMVLEPTQIKSIHNQGTFDPTNPSIYKSAHPYAVAGGGLMSALSPSQAQAIENIRAKDLPLEEAWNPVEAFGGGLGGGLRAALAGIVPDGAMDWAINGLMSGGK